jgi:ribosome-associated protein
METVKIQKILHHCCEALDAKKALDLQVFDVRGQSSITDFFILASANSEPHLRALSKITEDVLHQDNTKIIGIDYATGSGWLVIDAFDFIIHLLTEEQRKLYQLDNLWKNAKQINWEDLNT